MTVKILIPLILAVLLITGLVIRTLDKAGVWLQISPYFDGSCSIITGIVGAEDITIDQKTGYAYISTNDRRRRSSGEEIQGAIMGLDLDDPTARPTPLSSLGDRPFNPHGISLYESPDGNQQLFVINHPIFSSHQVEIFDIGRDHELTHLETIVDAALISPNDLTAVGPRSFYATNDHGYPTGLMRTLEDFLALPLAGVAYFDGTSGRQVAGDLSYPNGITVSADGDMLYVAQTTGRALTAYTIDKSSGALERQTTVSVGMGADNLEWTGDGKLLLTGHPKTLDFLAHAASPEAQSASEVLEVSVKPGDIKLRRIYLNEGDQISGSSVAARYGDTLLIGSVFEEKILRCVMN